MYEEEVKAALEASRREMLGGESEEADGEKKTVQEEPVVEKRMNKGKRKRDDDETGT
jgi:hypothetical protein